MKNNTCNKLLFGISGSSSATLSPYLVATLKQHFCQHIKIIVSDAAQKFVSLLALELLSGNKVYTGHGQIEPDVEIPHVQLTAASDLFVVMPASANTIGKAANGICDSFLTTTILASACPVVFVPSMNHRMWGNPALQANVERLKFMGHYIVQPVPGIEISSGQNAPGAMPPIVDVMKQLALIMRAEYAAVA